MDNNNKSTKTRKSYNSDKTEYRNLSVEEWNAINYAKKLGSYEVNYTPLKVCNQDMKRNETTREFERYLSEISQIRAKYANEIDNLEAQYYLIDDKESSETQRILEEINNLNNKLQDETTVAKIQSDINVQNIGNICY